MNDLQFGLVGTGYWAQETHANAIVATDGLQLASVWGRNPDSAAAVATRFDAQPFGDFDAFLDTVDAVSFAVPPHIQSELALRAVTAGKHVLLEKPIATSLAAADELVAAVAKSGVSSVVFFTLLFDQRVRAIVAEAEAANWSGGNGLWLGSALMDDNPFNTPWRHDKGGLWDLGPHALSVLWRTLGPIVEVDAVAGARDLVHVTLRHEGGASSTASMTLQASDAADGFSTLLWGPRGRQAMPVDDVDEATVLQLALTELARNIRGGVMEHECDVRFGRDIVEVIAKLEAVLESKAAR